MRILKPLAVATALLCLPVTAHAADAAALAKAFGAPPTAWGVQLSPDGTRIVYLTPVGTLGTAIVAADIASGATKVVLGTQNNTVRPAWCQWKTDKRLICMLSGVSNAIEDKLAFTRVIAIDADGGNPKTLGSRSNARTRTIIQTSGNVIDWLRDDPDHVLMQVELVEETTIGIRLGNADPGTSVQRVNVHTARLETVEAGKTNVAEFDTDNHGAVRLMSSIATNNTGYFSGEINYFTAPRHRRTGVRRASGCSMAIPTSAMTGSTRAVRICSRSSPATGGWRCLRLAPTEPKSPTC